MTPEALAFCGELSSLVRQCLTDIAWVNLVGSDTKPPRAVALDRQRLRRAVARVRADLRENVWARLPDDVIGDRSSHAARRWPTLEDAFGALAKRERAGWQAFNQDREGGAGEDCAALPAGSIWTAEHGCVPSADRDQSKIAGADLAAAMAWVHTYLLKCECPPSDKTFPKISSWLGNGCETPGDIPEELRIKLERSLPAMWKHVLKVSPRPSALAEWIGSPEGQRGGDESGAEATTCRRMTWQIARQKAEAIVKRQGWQKSLRQMATRVGCSVNTMGRAVQESPKLQSAKRKASGAPAGGDNDQDAELQTLIHEQSRDMNSRHCT